MGAGARSFDDDTFSLDIVRPGFAHRPLASEGPNGLAFGRGRFGRKLVLGRVGDQLFELQFHLVDQPLGALPARTVFVAFQLGDQQLQMGVERLDAGKLCLGFDRFGLRLQPRLAFRQQRGVSAGKIVRKGKRWQ